MPDLYVGFLLASPRWRFAWWSIVVTSVFTVTLHGFSAINPLPGPRWLWGCLETGSGIVATCVIALAALRNCYAPETQRCDGGVIIAAMPIRAAWHFYDRLPPTECPPFLALIRHCEV